MPKTITLHHKQLIKDQLKKTHKIIAAVACKVYEARPYPGIWNSEGLIGALVLVYERSGHQSLFLKLLDVHDKSIVWSQEIYKEFILYKESELFYSFPADSYMAGLAFANIEEARKMVEIIEKECISAYKSIESAPSPVSKTKKPKKLTLEDIEGPISVRQASHWGIGGDTFNIPSGWKAPKSEQKAPKSRLSQIIQQESTVRSPTISPDPPMTIPNPCSEYEHAVPKLSLSPQNTTAMIKPVLPAARCPEFPQNPEVQVDSKPKEFEEIDIPKPSVISTSPIPKPQTNDQEVCSKIDKDSLEDLSQSISDEGNSNSSRDLQPSSHPLLNNSMDLRSQLMMSIRNSKVEDLKKVAAEEKKPTEKDAPSNFSSLFKKAQEHRKSIGQ